MKKIILLVLVLFHFTLSGSEIEDALKALTISERFYLNNFFRACVRTDHFGYTIFSDKPVSLSGYFIRCRSDELASPYRNKLIARGWNVWKKHEHLFPHKNFIFCEEVEVFHDKDLDFTFKICHIYLINKEAFLNLLINYSSTFVKYLGDGFSPENFLAKVENTKTVTPHLNHSEALKGLVLGYGLEASLLFEEFQKDSFPPEPVSTQVIVSHQPSNCKIEPVVFIGNTESSETQRIKEHYSEPIEKIWCVYKEKNFLLIVLNALCSNPQ